MLVPEKGYETLEGDQPAGSADAAGHRRCGGTWAGKKVRDGHKRLPGRKSSRVRFSSYEGGQTGTLRRAEGTQAAGIGVWGQVIVGGQRARPGGRPRDGTRGLPLLRAGAAIPSFSTKEALCTTRVSPAPTSSPTLSVPRITSASPLGASTSTSPRRRCQPLRDVIGAELRQHKPAKARYGTSESVQVEPQMTALRGVLR